MHRDPRYWGRSSPPQPHHGYYNPAGGGGGGGGGYPPAPAMPGYDDPLAGVRGGGLEFQASETCPRNFVIFDQTYNRSTVMFHPSLAQRFNGGAYDGGYGGAGYGGGGEYLYAGEGSVRQKEDTEEIDALLSSEEGEEDDVVSTGRTPGGRGGSSPDSPCSSTSSPAAGGERRRGKKERMKKMVRTLKGIIPGGDGMDTPAVLDEAVRYLKSLKMEVKKLGAAGNGGGGGGGRS